MATKCLTCSGVYSQIGADGMLYFHACPPVVDPKTGATTARPNARDENVDPVKAKAKLEGAKVVDVTKAAGLGVTDVADVAPIGD